MSDTALINKTIGNSNDEIGYQSWVNVSSEQSPTESCTLDAESGNNQSTSSFEHLTETNSTFDNASGEVAAITNNNYLPDPTAAIARGEREDGHSYSIGNIEDEGSDDVVQMTKTIKSDHVEQEDDTVPSPTVPDVQDSYAIISSENYVNETDEVIPMEQKSGTGRIKQHVLSPVGKPGKLLHMKRNDHQEGGKPVGKVLPNLHATNECDLPETTVKCVVTEDKSAASVSVTQSSTAPVSMNQQATQSTPRSSTTKSKLPGAHIQTTTTPRRQLPQKSPVRKPALQEARGVSRPCSPSRKLQDHSRGHSPSSSRTDQPASPRSENIQRAAELEHLDMVEKRSLLPKMSEVKTRTKSQKETKLQGLRWPAQKTGEMVARASQDRPAIRQREASSDELRSSSSSRSSEQSPPPPHSPGALPAKRDASPKPAKSVKPVNVTGVALRSATCDRMRDKSPAGSADQGRRPEIPKLSSRLKSPLAKKKEVITLGKSKLPGLKHAAEQENVEGPQQHEVVQSPEPSKKLQVLGSSQKSVIKVTSFMKNEIPTARRQQPEKKIQEKLPSKSKLSQFGFRSPKVQRSDKVTSASKSREQQLKPGGNSVQSQANVNGYSSKIPGKKELMSPKSPRIPRAICKQGQKTTNGTLPTHDTGKQVMLFA